MRTIFFLLCFLFASLFSIGQGSRTVVTPIENSRSIISNGSDADAKPLWMQIQEEQEKKAKADSLERVRIIQERIQQERIAREKFIADSLEHIRMVREKVVADSIERIRIAEEKAEKERVAREKYVKDSIEQSRMAREKFIADSIEQVRIIAEKERLAREKFVSDSIENVRIKREKFIADSLERVRIAEEKAEKERVAQEKYEKYQQWLATLPMSHFLQLNACYSMAPEYGLGFSYGQVKMFGWYVSILSNFSTKFDSDYVADENGYINKIYPFYSGTKKTTYLSANLGFVLRLHIPLYLCVGVGYSYRTAFYELVDGTWASWNTKNAPSSGFGYEIGVMENIENFALSLGISSTTDFNANYATIKLGIGYFINRKK